MDQTLPLDTGGFDPLAYATDILEAQILPSDPVDWCRKKAKAELWSKQQDIMHSVLNHKLTAVKSGHGVGKSYTVSHLAAWWVDTHPIDETLVVTTAPSVRQVSVIMWEEIRKIHRRAQLQGEVGRADTWLINGLEVAFGRKPQDHDKHAFQGIHRKYVLVIIDEACGIAEWLWIAALSIATGDYCRIIAIGNPDDPSSYFAKVCKPGSGWNVLQISVFDSPKFTGEKVTQTALDTLVGQSYIDAMEAEVGRGSATWISKVLGEFPELDEFATIPLRWVHDAQERWIEWDMAGRPTIGNGQKHIGADIARFGRDKTVFAHKIGDVIEKIEVRPSQDTVKTAGDLNKRLSGQETAVIDTNGVGSGVYDVLKNIGKRVQGVNPGTRTKTTDKSKQIEFYNLRSAMMWNLREMLDPSKNPTLCIPPDDKLAEDLAAPRYENISGGKMVIEDKKALRKRIGRSTDRGDAVALAVWGRSYIEGDPDQAVFSWQLPKDEDDDMDALDWAEDNEDWRRVSQQDGVPIS